MHRIQEHKSKSLANHQTHGYISFSDPKLTFVNFSPGEEYTMKLQNLEKELDNEVPWFSLLNGSSFGKCTMSPEDHKTWQFVETAQWKESACASWESTWSNVFLFIRIAQMFAHFSIWFMDFIFATHYRVEGSIFFFAAPQLHGRVVRSTM